MAAEATAHAPMNNTPTQKVVCSNSESGIYAPTEKSYGPGIHDVSFNSLMYDFIVVHFWQQSPPIFACMGGLNYSLHK